MIAPYQVMWRIDRTLCLIVMRMACDSDATSDFAGMSTALTQYASAMMPAISGHATPGSCQPTVSPLALARMGSAIPAQAATSTVLATLPVDLLEVLESGTYPQAVTETLPPYRIVHASSSWCAFCGYKAENLAGKPISIVSSPEVNSQQQQDVFKHSLTTGLQASCGPATL